MNLREFVGGCGFLFILRRWLGNTQREERQQLQRPSARDVVEDRVYRSVHSRFLGAGSAARHGFIGLSESI